MTAGSVAANAAKLLPQRGVNISTAGIYRHFPFCAVHVYRCVVEPPFPFFAQPLKTPPLFRQLRLCRVSPRSPFLEFRAHGLFDRLELRNCTCHALFSFARTMLAPSMHAWMYTCMRAFYIFFFFPAGDRTLFTHKPRRETRGGRCQISCCPAQNGRERGVYRASISARFFSLKVCNISSRRVVWCCTTVALPYQRRKLLCC